MDDSQTDSQVLASESVQEAPDSACKCGDPKCTGGCDGNVPQMVYALGQLGFDFGSEARRDSITLHMGDNGNPHDPVQLLSYLETSPADSASILWTLNIDAVPVYCIQGHGPFGHLVYERLREFLSSQIDPEQAVERVSVPGYIIGNATLMNGQSLPVIWPELRGMFSWTTTALVASVCREQHGAKAEAVRNFLERVYYELRNLGTTSPERAINYTATAAFAVSKIFESALSDDLTLDTIEVEPSPVCRPESDCWDVKLTFFNPNKVLEQARKVYRWTVDVSDVVPVSVNTVRSWFVR